MFGHFTTLCMKGLRPLISFLCKICIYQLKPNVFIVIYQLIFDNFLIVTLSVQPTSIREKHRIEAKDN